MPSSAAGCQELTSRITFSARSSHVRLLPIEELGIRRPSSSTAVTSITATSSSQHPILHELGNMAEMDVGVLNFAGIDALAGLGIGLIGKPQMNATGHGQRAVQLRAGGGAR